MNQPSRIIPDRHPRDVESLLLGFNLTYSQAREARAASADAPAGFREIALHAREYGIARGNSGAGLLMHRIRRGEHFDAELAREAPRSRPTGWRFVRGSHGSAFVPDPNGTDLPPRATSG